MFGVLWHALPTDHTVLGSVSLDDIAVATLGTVALEVGSVSNSLLRQFLILFRCHVATSPKCRKYVKADHDVAHNLEGLVGRLCVVLLKNGQAEVKE